MLFWVTHQISLPVLIKILSRELLRFSSNAKSQSVKKKNQPLGTDLQSLPGSMSCFLSLLPVKMHIFSPKLLGLGVSLANENQAVFFPPAINNGQITKCRFWSWHVYCWWWCLNWWPTASFSLSWEGPDGRIGEEKKLLILTHSKTVG